MIEALKLIASLDSSLLEIAARSLQVSLSALFFASLVALPLGTILAISNFKLKPLVLIVLNSLIGLPPVVVGLVVYIMLSRSSPFGVLGLLYTPSAMIIAQAIIILPLIASVTHQVINELWNYYKDLLISLDAKKTQMLKTLLWDARHGLLVAVLAGFGRAIGEVGAVMIVGGNIENATRVLTTAIALETSKGDFALALSLGVVLIVISIFVNVLLHLFSHYKLSNKRWV